MMKLIDSLKSKGMSVSEAKGMGDDWRERWESRFAGHLTDEEKRAIYLHEGYLWHVFSFNKTAYLKEAEADQAFNRETKDTCFIFYEHLGKALIVEQAHLLTSDDFKAEADVYVMDPAFTWTYVRTHETEWCGPYFGKSE